MPITFKKIENENYFVSTWTGKPTDDDMINAYQKFYTNLEWSSELSELTDMSHVDLVNITTEGLKTISTYVHNLYEKHDILSSKTAVFIPDNILSFGIARSYQGWTHTSAETVKIFNDIDSAKAWIKE